MSAPSDSDARGRPRRSSGRSPSGIRTLPTATWLILALVPAASCQDPGGLPAEEKRVRIDEMYEGYKRSLPAVPEMTVEALQERLRGPDPPVLVDVRDDEERAVSTIPGALSRQAFEERRERLAGREIVTYCTIGYRSGLYTRELVEQGWKALNLRGSIVSWTHAGGALVKDGRPTRRVHVYGRRWNLVADGYEAVW